MPSELPVAIRTLDDSDINREFVYCQELYGFWGISYDVFIWTRKPKSFKIETLKTKMNKSEPLTIRTLIAVFRLFTEIFRFFLRRRLVFGL